MFAAEARHRPSSKSDNSVHKHVTEHKYCRVCTKVTFPAALRPLKRIMCPSTGVLCTFFHFQAAVTLKASLHEHHVITSAPL